MTKARFQEKGLKPAQFRALAVLISTGDECGAADVAGVSVRTLRRWRRSPEWEAEARRVETEAVKAASRRLAQLTQDAIATMEAIMKNRGAKDYVRQNAAEAILNHALRYRENIELAERLNAFLERMDTCGLEAR